MNAEMWQELHDGIEDYDGNSSAWDGFNAALEAMRQPITAEALLADGWEITDEEKYDDGVRAYARTYAPPVTDGALYFLAVVWNLDDDGETEIARAIMNGEDDDIELPNVRTMHDVRELVRLLGGAK